MVINILELRSWKAPNADDPDVMPQPDHDWLPSGRILDENASDDELYAWFVYHATIVHKAVELYDGAISMPVPNPDGTRQWVEILLTRKQLRREAWSDQDRSYVSFFDGRMKLVPAVGPVITGLRALAASLTEASEALCLEDNYIVLHEGRFWNSIEPVVPPVPGTFGPKEETRLAWQVHGACRVGGASVDDLWPDKLDFRYQ